MTVRDIAVSMELSVWMSLMDTPASVLMDTGEKIASVTCTGFILATKLPLLHSCYPLFLNVAVSYVRFPHLRCPSVSWPTVRTTPRAWSEVAMPFVSVLQSLGAHVVRSWSVSTLLTGTRIYYSLT